MSSSYRPDWNEVMADCGGARPDDNERIILTRGSARLAMSALRQQNAQDYYHNYGAAERELRECLARPATTPEQKTANFAAALAECEHYCATQTSGATECNCGSWYFRKLARDALSAQKPGKPE